MPTVAAANRVEVEVVVEGKGGCGVWALDLRERRRRLLLGRAAGSPFGLIDGIRAEVEVGVGVGVEVGGGGDGTTGGAGESGAGGSAAAG